MRLALSLLIIARLGAETIPQGIDELVAATMKEWSVPGLALAVVKDGKVVHSKGYGLRDVKNNLPVTPRTLFGIGSITKSFTVLALAGLVEEGWIGIRRCASTCPASVSTIRWRPLRPRLAT
ncbi:MAG: beta-lactamase family protein [Acidobacteria bacterium]|nr:beta-lactamase family protein [Acidobacteriota bacterium]MBI3472602.1 beta-lactamase family protein [Candidatus Solibacter usitatus]